MQPEKEKQFRKTLNMNIELQQNCVHRFGKALCSHLYFNTEVMVLSSLVPI